MTETEILQAIRLALSSGPRRLYRNNTGKLADPTGRWVNFGIAVGSGDLIGWRMLTVTPAMVGKTIAQFVSLEVKTPKGRMRREQLLWVDVVKAAGGCAGVAHNVEEAERILRE